MKRILFRATLMLLTTMLSAASAQAGSAFDGGNGTEESPYVINTSDDWDQIASHVANGDEGFSTAYYQLNNDISVKTMMGSAEHRFQGHFDGNGKKLTFDLYTRENYAAPFRYVNGATISNLHVGGTLAIAGMYGAGLVANTVGETTITNCRITLTITCRRYGDVSHAGVVAVNSGGTLAIEGCVFDGEMIGYGTHNWAGFVGWNERKDEANGTVTITRCLFAPKKTEMRITKTFVRSHNYGDDIIRLTDCYSTTVYGNDQDACVYKINREEGVNADINWSVTNVYSVSGTTFSSDAMVYDTQVYAKSGNNLSLTITLDESTASVPEGMTIIVFKNTGGKLTKAENKEDEYILSMGSDDAYIYANYVDENYTWPGDGNGTSEYPYIINTPERWDNFVEAVNSGKGDYATAYYQLTYDINVTTMACDEENKFQGHFNGSGHTLTINYGTEEEPVDEEYCAPFRYINFADIHDLNVAGTIYTQKKCAAGIAGHAVGGNTITNCRVSVAINSRVSGDGTHGGLVANISSDKTTITNCAFNGSLTGSDTHSCGGFVGWTNGNNGASVSFSNCLFKPASLTYSTNGSATFARGHDNNTKNITLNDCYYTSSLGTVQGVQAYADTNSSTQPLVEQSIAGVNCYVPGELVTNITADPTPTGAIIKWTGTEGCTYQVRYRPVANYFCGFETHPGDWTQIGDNDDGKLWNWIEENNVARTGNGCMTSYSFDPEEMAPLTPDNWLVSPMLTLGGKLRVWLRGADANAHEEHFAVYLSLDGEFYNNDDENLKELVPETVAANEFQEYGADLSAYRGQTGRIAIRHFNCTDQYFLIVDDFEIYDTDTPWTTIADADAAGTAITGLENNTSYEYQVVYQYKGTHYYMPIATLTTLADNAAPLGLAANDVTPHSATLSWKGYSDSYNLRYRSLAGLTATVTLAVPEDIWGDGSGYQMLLDAEHDTYGTVIPLDNFLNASGDAPGETYGSFEYTIPENADGRLDTRNVVDGKSLTTRTLTIPAGLYDWCIANPTPGDRVWIALDNGDIAGSQDNFLFEAGKEYTFTVTRSGDNDRVDMTVADTPDSADGQWTAVSSITATSFTLDALPQSAACQVQVQAVKGGKPSDWSTLVFTTGGPKAITLTDRGTNNSGIVAANRGRLSNVTLAGRTLYRDGKWNTLCLPFSLSTDALSDTPLKGFTIMELSNQGASNTGFNPTTGVLTLDFIRAYAIEAGHPYLVKWGDDDDYYYDDEDDPVDDITDPVFENVHLAGETPADNSVVSADGAVTFLGTYDTADLYTDTHSTLYLGADNTLYLPNKKNLQIGACRAFFKLDPEEKAPTRIALNFADTPDTNGIVTVSTDEDARNSRGGWYTIDGVKLDKQPVGKGIYINNGKKLVIKSSN